MLEGDSVGVGGCGKNKFKGVGGGGGWKVARHPNLLGKWTYITFKWILRGKTNDGIFRFRTDLFFKRYIRKAVKTKKLQKMGGGE